ncbi:hypothetical protein CE91St30_05780 [Raoultibacter timonensis]|uniref:Uncharacterized protein n=1 Tax=Raoultibacter timonensis TaxID=1907662 RepID=A0ABM7WG88_9ACTN|nr:hypothetical protein CE91St30_05780 [Raoultibacter timonensis]BDF49848.1 hypothetical protein CE91St31_05780 [Raoultibacter timonensis]
MPIPAPAAIPPPTRTSNDCEQNKTSDPPPAINTTPLAQTAVLWRETIPLAEGSKENTSEQTARDDTAASQASSIRGYERNETGKEYSGAPAARNDKLSHDRNMPTEHDDANDFTANRADLSRFFSPKPTMLPPTNESHMVAHDTTQLIPTAHPTRGPSHQTSSFTGDLPATTNYHSRLRMLQSHPNRIVTPPALFKRAITEWNETKWEERNT